MKAAAFWTARKARAVFRANPPMATYIVLRLTVIDRGWPQIAAGAGCIGWALARPQLAKRRKDRAVSGKNPLPTRKTQDPIRATKIAFPVVRNGQVAWHALFKAATYGTDEKATCHIQEALMTGSALVRFMTPRGRLLTAEEHGDPPALACMCGFYALKPEQQRSPATRWWMSAFANWNRRRTKRDPEPVYALLEVELLGRVLAHTKGYRAERQRVMRARLDGRCVMCGKAAKGFSAGTFIVGPHGEASLISTCGCQVPVRWDLQDVRNMAGTEVEWDPARQPLLTHLRRNR